MGVGDYSILDAKVNGEFVESITLSHKKDNSRKTYHFYPTAEALKTAYMLGEITTAVGLADESFNKTTFSSLPNTQVSKQTNYQKLTAVFINTGDSIMSEKKLRDALSYAIPNTFIEGERSFGPYPKQSWAFQEGLVDKTEDIEHAQLLLDASSAATESGKLTLSMKAFPKYKAVAEQLAKEWEKIGITTKIEYVSKLPDNFQLFLGDFNVQSDPDQYSLWHSTQGNNITNYNNARIDKLLEDGRKTVDQEERKKLYTDFQKYLVDDSPALFLYFPYEYTIQRK